MAGISGRKVAIVIGGATCVWEDYERTIALLDSLPFHVTTTTFVTNDSIPLFEDFLDVVTTLHPLKVGQWLALREHKGLNRPEYVVSYDTNMHPAVTDSVADWGGSSGLYGFKVAKEMFGIPRVILCGVPLDKDAGHIVRNKRWESADGFRKAWNDNIKDIVPFVRSWGGWSMKKLGGLPPDAAWLSS